MSKLLQQQPLILASGSPIRLKLNSPGLQFLVIPSDCDEEAIKVTYQSEDFLELGFTLAHSKAFKRTGLFLCSENA